jgi:hypothetical protein
MLGLFGIIGLAAYYKNADLSSRDARVYAIFAATYIFIVSLINSLIKYNSSSLAIEHAGFDCVIAFFVAWLYFFCVDKTEPWPWFQWVVILFGAALFFLLV